jgi:HAMP domain-containing protein
MNDSISGTNAKISEEIGLLPFYSRLSVQIVLGLLIISALGLISINALFFEFANTTLRNNFGENTVLAVQQTVDEINDYIESDIEFFEAYAHSPSLAMFLRRSNAKFNVMENRDAYIAETDAAWIDTPKGTTTPLIRAVLENEQVDEILPILDFFTRRAGYTLYPEVFVTNKYGVNVFSTNRTSDYYQADEEWWQNAVRNDVYISPVEHDESADVDSIDIGIAVRDSDGLLIGVMKVVMNARKISTILNDFIPDRTSAIDIQSHTAHGHTSHRTMNFVLLKSDGTIIYSTDTDSSEDQVGFLERYADDKVDLSNDGYFTTKNADGVEVLVAHAHGLSGVATSKWVLVLEHEIGEVLATARAEANRLVLIIGLVLGLVFLVAMLFTVRAVVMPITSLTKVAARIASGNLTEQADTRGRGEIGYLGKVFNRMTASLVDSKKELEGKVIERTKELQEIHTALKVKMADLEKFQAITVDRELKMIELKKELEALKKNENGN